jgi:predicted ATPase/DNA-binding XRE family transcriptional regulator
MTMAGAEPFGALLRRLRQDAGLTQEELAERAGLSVRGISDLERSVNRTARGETAHLLAVALALDGSQRDQFLANARGRRSTEVMSSCALPIPPTPLIGRAAELAVLRGLLCQDDIRCVTLTGVGGSGKTRLAIEVAASLQAEFSDGARFVDLAPLTDPHLIAQAIAQALGVHEVADSSLDDSLVAHLGPRMLLLLLDNFEQVLSGASLVASLLAQCPTLTVLVTSRTPLRLRGEYVFPVPALELPVRDQVAAVGDRQAEAVALFVQRLRVVSPDFLLTPRNIKLVGEICRRLDGLPLAIELAAARGNALSLPTLLALLDNRLAFLTGGPRDAPPRQRTMRDAIAWSYDLLAAEEQVLFHRLGVFVGGCTLEAVEWIMDNGIEARAPLVPPVTQQPMRATASLYHVLDQLSTLVESSLLRRVAVADDETRFRMLETVREYAVANLVASGDQSATRRRHAAYFTALAEASVAHLTSGDQCVWLDWLERDHDNFRAALTWALQDGATETALRLCAALALFWRIRGHLAEGRRWCTKALARGDEVPRHVRAAALHGHGMLTHWQGDYAASQSLYQAALALRREVGDEQGIALSLNSLGILADDIGDYQHALALQGESLRRWEALGNQWGTAHALCDIGNIAKAQGRDGEALAHYERSLALFQQVDDRQGKAMVLDNLGEVAMRRRAYTRAVSLFEEALQLQRALDYPQFVARLLNKLGTATLAQGDVEAARVLHEESLAIQKTLGDRRGMAFSLMHLGNVARERGDTGGAAERYCESLRLRWDLGHKDGVATCLEGLATTAIVQRPQYATRLFAAAAALRETIGSSAPTIEASIITRDIARARSRLSEAEFGKAWSDGYASMLEAAVAEVFQTLERPAARVLSNRLSPEYPVAPNRRGTRRRAAAG